MGLGNAVLLHEEGAPQAARDILQACGRAGIPRGVIHAAAGPAEGLALLPELSAVAYSGEAEALRRLRVVLAERPGLRLPLIEVLDDTGRFATERVISVDTTASGGNATLLAEMEQDAV